MILSTELKDFELEAKLGSGSFSTVYKVRRLSDNKDYAMKRIKINGVTLKEKAYALNEIRILASLNHPNIIQYYESIFEHKNNTLNIIMEYANNGDLNELIKKQKGDLIPED